MFSFLLKKGAIPFTKKEDSFIKELLLIFRDHCQREGAFLHQVDIQKYQFFWSVYMRDHPDGTFGGIIGCWDPGTRWKIFLLPRADVEIGIPSIWGIGDERAIDAGGYLLLDCIATTAVHEINHSWQFSVNPVLWIINRLVTRFVEYIPYLKKITIEDDVDRHISENKEVNEFFKDLLSAWDNYVYLQRCEKQLAKKLYEQKDAETITYAEEQLRYANNQFLEHPEWRRKAVISLFTIMA